MTNNEPRINEQWTLNNSGSGYTIQNASNGRYLYSSNNGTLSINTNSRVWNYDSNTGYLYYRRNQNTRYYIRNNNGTWTTTNNANQATPIYFTTKVANSNYINTNEYLSFSNGTWGLTDTLGTNTTITLKTVTSNYISDVRNYYVRYNNGFEMSTTNNNNTFNFATYDLQRTIRTTNLGNISNNNANVAVTITSLYNHVDYRTNATLDLADGADDGYGFISANKDLQIEYLSVKAEGYNYIKDGTTTNDISETYAGLEGNHHNVRIGRGMTPTSWTNDSATIFGFAFGGSDSSSLGSSSSYNNDFRFVVESGRYSSIMAVRIANDGNYSSYSAINYYGKMTFVLGNDYDRITNNNDHLQVYYRIGSSNNYGTVGKPNSNEPAYLINIKSGNIGYDYFMYYE